jgi:hypothetical protein
MAVREFTARDGRRWRAWDVAPETVEPLTRAEDYLADCFRDGWVVFETIDGRDKRRLCPPPYAWEHRSDANLDDLLMRAEVLRPRGQVRVRGDVVIPADLPPTVPLEVVKAIPRDIDGDIDMRYLGVVRSFRYPEGEVWRASVVEDNPDSPLVLRFSSESHTIDLVGWPNDWADRTDEQLIALMQRGRSTVERRRRERPPRDPGEQSRDSGAR